MSTPTVQMITPTVQMSTPTVQMVLQRRENLVVIPEVIFIIRMIISG